MDLYYEGREEWKGIIMVYLADCDRREGNDSYRAHVCEGRGETKEIVFYIMNYNDRESARNSNIYCVMVRKNGIVQYHISNCNAKKERLAFTCQ